MTKRFTEHVIPLTHVSRRDLLLLFVLALIPRILLLLFSMDQVGQDAPFKLSPDTGHYLAIARSMLGDGGSSSWALLMWGPGYGSFLAVLILVFGYHALPLALVNVVMSAGLAPLVCLLGARITGSRAVGIVAGLISVLSWNSITLSVFLLSDTPYLFFFLLGLVSYLYALDQDRWMAYVAAGVLSGIAVILRSIGQFWPIAMLMIALGWPHLPRHGSVTSTGTRWRSRRMKVAICLVIAALPALSWSVHNYIARGIPAVAFSTAGGPANVAALALDHSPGRRQYRDIQAQWVEKYVQDNNLGEVGEADVFGIHVIMACYVLMSQPWEMLEAYAFLTWENLNEISYLHRIAVPEFNEWSIPMEGVVRRNSLDFAPLVLAMAAILLLWLSQRPRELLVLGTTYFYFASLIGFTRWQGARLFFPGEAAWTILAAIVLVAAARALRSAAKKIADWRTAIPPLPGRG